MNRAEFYSEHNSLQRTDALYVAENYLRLIKWKQDKDIILDVGCGDGSVLSEIVIPRISKNYGKILGADISADMIEYARMKNRNMKISFIKLDIECNTIPIEFKEKFDHILSFYCFHWVMKQRQAMTNLHEMLKPGADMLLTFLAIHPIYEVYQTMRKSNKWAQYMNNFDRYISPYQYSANPEEDLKKLLSETGFCVHLCRTEKRSHVYPNFPKLLNACMAVNPFIDGIPKEKMEDYIEDYVATIRQIKSTIIETCSNNNEEMIKCPYSIFIVVASKSHLK